MSAEISDLFIGREAETALLSGKLSAAVRGDGQVVLVSGEAGIGKTRLLNWLKEQAEEQKVSVHFGRCRETAGAPPFWPWISALSGAFGADSDIISRLEGDGGSGDFEKLSEAAQFRMFDAFSGALRELTADSPTVLVLEDIHWADAASLKLLEFITPDIATLPVLLACSFRDSGFAEGHPMPGTAGQIARGTHASRIELARFGRQEIEALFSGVSNAATPDGLIDETLRRTDGNPLFAVETLKLLDAEGLLASDARPGGTDGITRVPSGVAEAVTRRISDLPQSSVKVLQDAAVLGNEFTVSLLSTMSAVDTVDLLPRLDPLVSSGVLVQDSTDGTLFRFSHALVRDAIADNLSVSERARRHRSAAAAIETVADRDMTAYAGTLAHHYTECRALTGDEPVIKYSMIAGEQALSVYAYEEAGRYFQDAVDLSESRSMDEEVARAHFGLGRALSLTLVGADRARVGNALEAAFEYALSSGVIDLAVRVATFPMNQHMAFRERYHRLIEQALDLVAPDSIEAGYMQNNLGTVIQFATGDFDRANEALRTAIAIGEDHGDLNLQAVAVSNLLDVRHHHNLHLEDDLDIALRSVDLARKCNNPDAEAKGLRTAAYTSRERDNIADAVKYAEQGLAAAERFRHGEGTLYAAQCLADMMMVTGDWDRYRELSDKALEFDPRNTNTLTGRVGVEHLTGSTEQEEKFYDQIVEVGRTNPSNDYYARVNAGMAAAWTSMAAPERGQVAVGFAREVLRTPDLPRRAALQAYGALSVVALNQRDRELATEVYDWIIARPEVIQGEGIVLRTLARIEAFVGHADDAIARIEPFYDRVTKTKPVLDYAMVCYEFAEVLIERATTGDLERSEELLHEAEDLAERYELPGLQTWIETLRSRVARSETDESQPSPPAGLSDREIEVLRLVSQGLSNPEIAERLIISRHTVVRHLANIFSKTGVSSRSEATAFAVRNGID